MIFDLKRTDSGNKHFQQLVVELDNELRIRDGSDHAFYAQFNQIAVIKYAIVAYENGLPAGCGAIKEYSSDTMEVKRMYVLPVMRKRGLASKLLRSLEQWTVELGHAKCRLETGKNQPEALALYKKSGYAIIPNYGQYQHIKNSVCFEKRVSVVVK